MVQHSVCKKGPAASIGLASFSNDAAAFIRRARPDLAGALIADVIIYIAALRACMNHAIAPEVPAAPTGITSHAGVAAPYRRAGCDGRSPAFSVCERGSQHRQASLLSRAMRGHAIVPDVITHGAAISGCDQGPAASAGLIFLTCDAGPCHRAGCHRSLCSPSARGEGAQQPLQD